MKKYKINEQEESITNAIADLYLQLDNDIANNIIQKYEVISKLESDIDSIKKHCIDLSYMKDDLPYEQSWDIAQLRDGQWIINGQWIVKEVKL